MSLRSLAYRVWNAARPMLPNFSSRDAQLSVGMIMVHDVHDPRAEHGRPPETSVSLECFESNILGLASAFAFVRLDDAVAMLAGQQAWRPKSLVLTFDDSMKCLVDLVLPRLVGWGIPATFYISTEAIDLQQRYWWHRLDCALACRNSGTLSLPTAEGGFFLLDFSPGSASQRILRKRLRAGAPDECERLIAAVEAAAEVQENEVANPSFALMSWDDVRMLAQRGMTIGCHSRRHPNLTLLEAQAIEDELHFSRNRIRVETDQECRHFCYPYGAFSPRICAAVRKAGFVSAVTTARPGWNRPGNDLFQLKRFHLHAEPYCLPCLLSGFGQVLSRLRAPRSVESS